MSAEPDNKAGAKDFLGLAVLGRGREAANEAGDPPIWCQPERRHLGLHPPAAEGRRVSSAPSVTQFLDRDTRPEFAVQRDDPGAADLYLRSRRHRRDHSRTSRSRSSRSSSSDPGAAAWPHEERTGHCDERSDTGTGGAGNYTTSSLGRPRRRRRKNRSGGLRDLRSVNGADKVAMTWMWPVPTILHVGLVWIPTLASIRPVVHGLEGLGGLDTIEWIGLENYVKVFTNSSGFWPAIQNNMVLLVFLFIVPTALGISWRYPSTGTCAAPGSTRASYFPGRALAGAGRLHVAAASTQGPGPDPIGAGPQHGTSRPDRFRRPLRELLGDPGRDRLAAHRLHHGALPGRAEERRQLAARAAMLDGSNEWQVFRHVVFPSLKPINVVVAVITVIEALRAFDIIFVLNVPRKTEVLSILTTNNLSVERGRQRRPRFCLRHDPVHPLLRLRDLVRLPLRVNREERNERPQPPPHRRPRPGAPAPGAHPPAASCSTRSSPSTALHLAGPHRGRSIFASLRRSPRPCATASSPGRIVDPGQLPQRLGAGRHPRKYWNTARHPRPAVC